MLKIALFLSVIIPGVATSASTQSPPQCDIIAALAPESNTVIKVLTQLSNDHDFKLAYLPSFDRNIRSVSEIPLQKLLRKLTADLNSIVIVENVEGCDTNRITSIEILQVGEERVLANTDLEPEYIEIYDMDTYAMEALLKQRKAEHKRMSPEQKKHLERQKMLQENVCEIRGYSTCKIT